MCVCVCNYSSLALRSLPLLLVSSGAWGIGEAGNLVPVVPPLAALLGGAATDTESMAPSPDTSNPAPVSVNLPVLLSRGHRPATASGWPGHPGVLT